METLDVIRNRCSLKTHLSDREVEREKIDIILEAGRLAPSARNMQPWRFIIVRGKNSVNNLVTASFMETNQMVKEAPIVIVICARPSDDVIRDGKEYYLFDAGLAVENMLLAATNLGLVTHPMTGINESEVKKILHIPDDVRVVAVTPLAYPAEGSYDVAAKERLSQRSRREVKEVVYFDRWNEPEPA
jgi:nitroreductase